MESTCHSEPNSSETVRGGRPLLWWRTQGPWVSLTHRLCERKGETRLVGGKLGTWGSFTFNIILFKCWYSLAKTLDLSRHLSNLESKKDDSILQSSSPFRFCFILTLLRPYVFIWHGLYSGCVTVIDGMLFNVQHLRIDCCAFELFLKPGSVKAAVKKSGLKTLMCVYKISSIVFFYPVIFSLSRPSSVSLTE